MLPNCGYTTARARLVFVTRLLSYSYESRLANFCQRLSPCRLQPSAYRLFHSPDLMFNVQRSMFDVRCFPHWLPFCQLPSANSQLPSPTFALRFFASYPPLRLCVKSVFIRVHPLAAPKSDVGGPAAPNLSEDMWRKCHGAFGGLRVRAQARGADHIRQPATSRQTEGAIPRRLLRFVRPFLHLHQLRSQYHLKVCQWTSSIRSSPNISEPTFAIELTCTSRGVIRIKSDTISRPLTTNLFYFLQTQPANPLAL